MFGDSLKGLWFPEYRDASGNVRDLSGNGNDGTPTAVTFGERPLAPGLVGRSAGFNGTSSTIVIPDGASIRPVQGEPYTVSVWFCAMKHDEPYYLANKRSGSSTSAIWGFRVENSGGITAFLKDQSGSQETVSVAANAVEFGKPYLATISWHPGDNELRVWLNGNLVGTSTGALGDISNDGDFALGNIPGQPLWSLGFTQAVAVSRTEHNVDLAKRLTNLSGIENPPAYYVPGYVSAYPTPTTIATKPELLIDAAAEPDPPAVGAGHESPTNLGEMFHPEGTGITVSADQTSEQPIWLGPWEGWECVDDRWSVGDAGDFAFLHTSNGWHASFLVRAEPTSDAPYTLAGTARTFSQTGYTFQLDYRNDGNDVRVIGSAPQSWSGAAPTDGEFHLVEFVAGGGEVELFVDGESKGARTYATDAGADTYPLSIGASPGGINSPLDGAIRAVRIATSTEGFTPGDLT